jgi:hypothetical protein
VPKEKNNVQEELDEYRKTGIAYLSEDDVDMDFSNVDKKPKSE